MYMSSILSSFLGGSLLGFSGGETRLQVKSNKYSDGYVSESHNISNCEASVNNILKL